MPAFQEMYPELGAQEPLMDGEMAAAPTPLKRMRRQQLHDLATAWGIRVLNGGTKEEILPALMAAERAGVFKTPPKYPEFARKAMRNSDEPPLPPVQAVQAVQEPMPDYRSMELGGLTAACDAKGIDTDRRGGDYMIRALEGSHGADSTPA